VQSFSTTFNIFDRDKLKTLRTQIVSKQNNKFAHAFVKHVAQKLRGKLLDGDTLCNGTTSCCNALRKVDLNSTSCNTVLNVVHQKTLRDNPCYTLQFSRNLFCNGVARQVAEKIAQCNSTFTG